MYHPETFHIWPGKIIDKLNEVMKDGWRAKIIVLKSKMKIIFDEEDSDGLGPREEIEIDMSFEEVEALIAEIALQRCRSILSMLGAENNV